MITAPLSVVSTVCRLPTSAGDMQLLCDAELSQFWRELPFSGIAEGSRVMVLPAMPPDSGFPELKSMYVRESYERLTDMATDGGLHRFVGYIVFPFNCINVTGCKQLEMRNAGKIGVWLAMQALSRTSWSLALLALANQHGSFTSCIALPALERPLL